MYPNITNNNILNIFLFINILLNLKLKIPTYNFMLINFNFERNKQLYASKYNKTES